MKESVTGKLRCLALASLCIHLSFLSGIAQSKGIALIPEALQSLQIEWDRYDVYGYSLKHPSFSDYAYKSRYIFLPKNTKAALDLEEGILTFPDETVVVKRFFYASAAKNTRCYTAEGQLDALLLDHYRCLRCGIKGNESEYIAPFPLSALLLDVPQLST